MSIKPQFKIFSSILAFSLLFGVFFVPAQTKAESTDTALQPKTSCASVLQDKDNKDNAVDENKDINISGSCLVPGISHTSITGGADGDFFSDQVSLYVIRKGDSISQIADMFGVSTNTIYWANNMKRGDSLKEGETLIILPISGVEHIVKKGDTLQSIAKLYNADATDIALYNGIAGNSQLAIGDKLTVPDAEMPNESSSQSVSKTNSKTKVYYSNQPVRDVSGYFKNPLPYGHKTQGLHDGKRAIDIGAPTGTPIYAAASGTVVIARNGWNGGYGNFVVIKHPNGTETRYAHMSKLGTHSGAQVSQGEVIGYVGSTGRSTGSHVHFEIRGAKNPF